MRLAYGIAALLIGLPMLAGDGMGSACALTRRATGKQCACAPTG